MRADPYSLNVVATTGPGTPLPCKDMCDKWVEVAGIAGGAVLRIEGTIGGSQFTALTPTGAGTTDISSNGIYEFPHDIAQIRTNRTVQGSGTPVVTLLGRLGRSE